MTMLTAQQALGEAKKRISDDVWPEVKSTTEAAIDKAKSMMASKEEAVQSEEEKRYNDGQSEYGQEPLAQATLGLSTAAVVDDPTKITQDFADAFMRGDQPGMQDAMERMKKALDRAPQVPGGGDSASVRDAFMKSYMQNPGSRRPAAAKTMRDAFLPTYGRTPEKTEVKPPTNDLVAPDEDRYVSPYGGQKAPDPKIGSPSGTPEQLESGEINLRPEDVVGPEEDLFTQHGLDEDGNEVELSELGDPFAVPDKTSPIPEKVEAAKAAREQSTAQNLPEGQYDEVPVDIGPDPKKGMGLIRDVDTVPSHTGISPAVESAETATERMIRYARELEPVLPAVGRVGNALGAAATVGQFLLPWATVGAAEAGRQTPKGDIQYMAFQLDVNKGKPLTPGQVGAKYREYLADHPDEALDLYRQGAVNQDVIANLGDYRTGETENIRRGQQAVEAQAPPQEQAYWIMSEQRNRPLEAADLTKKAVEEINSDRALATRLFDRGVISGDLFLLAGKKK